MNVSAVSHLCLRRRCWPLGAGGHWVCVGCLAAPRATLTCLRLTPGPKSWMLEVCASLVVFPKLVLDWLAGDASRSLATWSWWRRWGWSWSCSMFRLTWSAVSCSFCQLRTARMSGWTPRPRAAAVAGQQFRGCQRGKQGQLGDISKCSFQIISNRRPLKVEDEAAAECQTWQFNTEKNDYLYQYQRKFMVLQFTYLVNCPKYQHSITCSILLRFSDWQSPQWRSWRGSWKSTSRCFNQNCVVFGSCSTRSEAAPSIDINPKWQFLESLTSLSRGG